RRVEDRATISDGRCVNEDIYAPEGSIRGRDHLTAILHNREVCAYELGLAPALAQALCHRPPLVCAASADHDARCAALGQVGRDRLTQTLRPASHDRNASIEPDRTGSLITHIVPLFVSRYRFSLVASLYDHRVERALGCR